MSLKANVKSRFRPVFWGLVFIVAATLLILYGADVNLGEGITAWRIIAGMFLGGWLIYEIIGLKISRVFFPLAFLFLVFQDPISRAAGKNGENIIAPWIILVAALFLTIGFTVIFPNKDKRNFTRKSYYFDAGKDLSTATIHDNLGFAHVYVTNRNAYDGSGIITIMDNVGVITIHLPGTWYVAVQASDNIGKVIVPDQSGNSSKSITLVVKDNMGTVSVVFD